LGVHNPRTYQHGTKRHQRPKKKEPPLEDPRIHIGHEQRHSVCGPNTRPATEDRPHKLGPSNTQKRTSKPADIALSGQKEKEVCKIRPFDLHPFNFSGPLSDLAVRTGHRPRGTRDCPTRPRGIDRLFGRPNVHRPCLSGP
jgi:hypothetical protein